MSTTTAFQSRGTPYETDDLEVPGAPTAPAGVQAGDLLMIVAFSVGSGPDETRNGTPYCSDPGANWREMIIDGPNTPGGFVFIPGESPRGLLQVWFRIADGTSADTPPNVELRYDGDPADAPNPPSMIVEAWRFSLPNEAAPFGYVPNVKLVLGTTVNVSVPGIYMQKDSLAAVIGVNTFASTVADGDFANLSPVTQHVDNNFSGFSHSLQVWLDSVSVDDLEGNTGQYTTTLSQTVGPWGVLLVEFIASDFDSPALVADYVVEVAWNETALIIGEGKLETGTFAGIGSDFGGAYDDVSSDCEQFTIVRGRDDPLTPVQAGICEIVLYDEDGLYNPENTESPLYAGMKPMREVRIRALFQEGDYGMFRGLIREISFDPITRRTRIHAEDLFLRLSRVRPVIAETSAGTTGSLIKLILEESLIPGSLINVDANRGDSGFTFSMLGTSDSRTALQGISDLLEAERGSFYVDRNGLATYRDRYSQLTAKPVLTMVNVFKSYVPGVSIENVINTARVTREGGVQQVTTDEESRDLYGPGDIAIESPYFEDDIAAKGLADFLVFQLSQPQNPMWDLPYLAGYDPLVMRAALTADLKDRITVINEDQPGLADDYYIESITHNVVRGSGHEVRWKLARRLEIEEYFVFGESAFGGGDILGYY